MRSYRFLTTVMVALGAMVLSASPAIAQDYPPPEPTLTAEPTTVFVGETVTFTGTGFGPGDEIVLTAEVEPFAAGAGPAGTQIMAGSGVMAAGAAPAAYPPGKPGKDVLGTTTADEDGTFTFEAELTEPGRVTVTAYGKPSGVSASVTVTVLEPQNALPVTGDASGWLLRAGGGSLAAGAVLVAAMLLWRQRRVRART